MMIMILLLSICANINRLTSHKTLSTAIAMYAMWRLKINVALDLHDGEMRYVLHFILYILHFVVIPSGQCEGRITWGKSGWKKARDEENPEGEV